MFNPESELWVPQELQQQMTQTPGASPDDTGLLGLIATLGATDLGYLDTFTFQRNTEKKELESRRAPVRGYCSRNPFKQLSEGLLLQSV